MPHVFGEISFKYGEKIISIPLVLNTHAIMPFTLFSALLLWEFKNMCCQGMFVMFCVCDQQKIAKLLNFEREMMKHTTF